TSDGAARRPARRAALRFFLHESDDDNVDRARLDALVELLGDYPGPDHIRLFVHTRDNDRIELHLPDADACPALRAAGIKLLGEHGGAEPLADPAKTRGVEPLEV